MAVSAQATIDPNLLIVADAHGISGSAINQYSATIDWGDGSAPSVGTLAPNPKYVGPGSPPIQVEGDHTYVLPGTYTIHVSVAGTAGPSASTFGSASVSAAPAYSTVGVVQESVARRSAFAVRSLAMVTTSEANTPADDFFAMINWGDGSAPEAATIVRLLVPATANVPAHTVFEVQGSHAYALARSFTIQVTVARVGGSSAQTSDGIVVTKAKPKHMAHPGTGKAPKVGGKTARLHAKAQPKRNLAANRVKNAGAPVHPSSKKHTPKKASAKHPHGPLG